MSQKPPVICRTNLVLPVQAKAPVPVPKNSILQPVFTKAGLPKPKGVFGLGIENPNFLAWELS